MEVINTICDTRTLNQHNNFKNYDMNEFLENKNLYNWWELFKQKFQEECGENIELASQFRDE